jgi:hypothetical protein
MSGNYSHYVSLDNDFYDKMFGLQITEFNQDPVNQHRYKCDVNNYYIAFDACCHLATHSGGVLCNVLENDEPSFYRVGTFLMFNARGNPHDHNRFHLHQHVVGNGNGFDFLSGGPPQPVKYTTNHEPHDYFVVLCLWLCDKLCRGFHFTSDGGDAVTIANASFQGSEGTVTKVDYTPELAKFGIFIRYSAEDPNVIEEVEIGGKVRKYSKY